MQTSPTNPESFDLLGAYSLGATTPEENRAIRELLANSPEAVEELSGYMIVREALTTMPPPANIPAPRPDFLDDLFKTSEPKPIATPVVNPADKLRQFTPEPTPTQPERQTWAAGIWYAAGSVAAALILVVGMGVVVNALVQEMQADRAALIALVQANTTPVNAQPVVTNSTVQTVMQSAEAHHIALTPAVEGLSGGNAQVIWDAETGVGVLVVSGMPALPSDETYYLWLVSGELEVKAGVFNVDENGGGFLVFHASEPLTAYDVVGINVESSPNSQTPTTPHLMTGSI